MALWKMESSVAERVIRDWLKEYPIQLIMRSHLSEGDKKVIKKGTVLTQIILNDGRAVAGRMFIDASYEGDLLAAAGVKTTIGREANSKYGETLNGIRQHTSHAQFAVKVDPYVIPGVHGSGVIPTIQDEPLGTPGTGDENIQAYCFRVCLTTTVENKVTFSKSEKYDRSQYQIYLKYLGKGGKLYTPRANLPNNKTDLGAWHDLSHNLYGMNKKYPGGTQAERKRILQEHETFTKGLFFFLATDSAVGRLAPALQAEWAKWGYAKD